MEITSSQQIVFPENFPYNIDIWCCGGGCSGWAYKMVTWGGFRVVAGFGQPGAYCNQLNNYQVSGKTLNINIGSGGVSSNQITEQIGQGGNTSITVDSYNILSGTGAKNKGGFALDSNRANPGTGLAGNGGTGAGLADISYGSSYGYAENGLINGATSSHYIAVTNPYGQGDGKDKHIFGDSNRTLCCSSSGGVACEYQGRVLIGSPGSGAGTNTVLSSFSGSGQEIKAGDAVTWGSSGGNCFVDGSGSFSCQSGAGKQGVVYIRWPSQSQ